MILRRVATSGIFVLGIFCLATPSLAIASTTTPKEVALTFDDGPYGAPTAQILSILEKEHIPATFFLIGKNVQEYPDLARREVADGDEIGNHTFDHAKNLASSTAEIFKTELDTTEQIIASTTGIHATLFRPPYGSISSTMREVSKNEGYKVVLWNVDPRDWDFSLSPAKSIVSRVLSQVKPNSIILMHDGRDTHVGYPRSNTITALPIIISDLQKRGYTFVTVDKLVR